MNEKEQQALKNTLEIVAFPKSGDIFDWFAEILDEYRFQNKH